MSTWRLATGQTMEVEHVDWTTLRPHPDNARNGDTDIIGESVDELGVYRPLIVSTDDVVLAGNHLYAVIGERGGGEVPIVRMPFDHEDERAVRLLLVDNRAADLGRYDDGLLADLLESIRDSEAGLIGSGYADEDLDDVKARIEAAEHMALNANARPAVGATQDTSYEQFLERYADRATRSLILNYPLDTFAWLVAQIGLLRDREDVEDNATLIVRLVEQATGNPAPAPAETPTPEPAEAK